MENKGFADNQTNIETPNDIGITEKHLKPNKIRTNKIDINVSSEKLPEPQCKEFKKNLFILSTLILALSVLGIYLSL